MALRDMGARPAGRRLAWAATSLSLAQVISGIAGLFATAIVAHKYSAASTGEYAFLTSTVFVSARLVNAGPGGSASRFLASWHDVESERSNALIRWILVRTVLAGVVLGAGVVALSACGLRVLHLGVAGSAEVCGGATAYFVGGVVVYILTGEQRFGVVSRVMVTRGVALPALILTGVITRASPQTLAVLWLLGGVLGGAAAVAEVLQRACRARQPLAAPERCEVSKYSRDLLLVSAVELIVWGKVEVFFLSGLRGAREVAFFSLPFDLAYRTLGFVPAVANVIAVPYVAMRSGISRQHGISRALALVALLVCPASAAILAAAPGIVLVLWGEQYVNVIPILRVLVVSTAVTTISGMCIAALLGAGEQRVVLKVTGVLALVELIACAVAIPFEGAWGAALANGGTQVVASIWLWREMDRRLSVRVIGGRISGPLAIGLLGGLCGLWVSSSDPSSLLRSALAACTALVVAGAGLVVYGPSRDTLRDAAGLVRGRGAS